eukprot:Blabericola_migrator_1__10378@NODE_585_length_7468_cov_222_283070_g432_i0_p5_GENE_NODE_585_length_7468_cov_222_283070_g432_i0NODE_585_length_7468_cov_222_283070_g432_i0_p5_ORF_typecomplete_len141_score19_59_NODE_585_length_7468_cov_222_283070_g432_i065636985
MKVGGVIVASRVASIGASLMIETDGVIAISGVATMEPVSMVVGSDTSKLRLGGRLSLTGTCAVTGLMSIASVVASPGGRSTGATITVGVVVVTSGAASAGVESADTVWTGAIVASTACNVPSVAAASTEGVSIVAVASVT